MDEHQILSRDLYIMEEMVKELNPYLMSESMWWAMTQSDLPRLTLGGCLMRKHRLSILQNKLSKEEQVRLQETVRQLAQVLAANITRFEYRAHQELRTRLSEWAGHLRALKSDVMAEIEHYANIVDTRVVITATIDKLQEPPYQLDPKISAELDQLDQNLRNRWQAGDFVWSPVWMPAYPQDKYWFLYGQRKQR